MNNVNLGLVTVDNAGWKTVRKRWEEDLAEYNPSLHHIEDYARSIKGLTDRYGGRSIGMSLAGRAASAAAISAGANVVLLSTLQCAPFAPLPRGVNYIIYGDCTTTQLAKLYGGKKLRFPGSWVDAGFHRLVKHGCYFLCMTEWYRNALRDQFGISDEQLILLPFYVDTEKWKPLSPRPANARKQVLFIGGELYRKGADIVYDLARLEKFRDVDFHIVSPNAEAGPDNLYVHRSFSADTDDLVRLASNCDVFVLPTRADAASIAALEAAACGVPAIITRRGGIPEVVVDGVTGSILPEPTLDSFAKELSIYLSNPEFLAQRGWNARQHVERNYSKPQHLATLRGVIDRTAMETRRQGGSRLRDPAIAN